MPASATATGTPKINSLHHRKLLTLTKITKKLGSTSNFSHSFTYPKLTF